MGSRHTRDEAIDRALRAGSLEAERVESRAWRVTLLNGTPLSARARYSETGWLELVAEQPDGMRLGGCSSPWGLLQLNARFPGCAHLASTPRGELRLQGEIYAGGDDDDAPEPRESEPALERRVASLCEDVCAAHREAHAFDSLRPDTPILEPHGVTETLTRLCAEAGWAAQPRAATGGASVAFDAGAAGFTFEAHLTLDRDSRLHAAAVLSTSSVGTPATRDAIGQLLLIAASTVRGVKGVALGPDAKQVAGLAAAVERFAVTPRALDRALAALAIACAQAGREVRALQDEAIAVDYLRLRRRLPADAGPPITDRTELEETVCLQVP
jgi:hypothetical protein